MIIQYQADLVTLDHLIAARNAQSTHVHGNPSTQEAVPSVHAHPTQAPQDPHTNPGGITHTHPNTGTTHAHPETNGTTHTHTHPATQETVHPVVVQPDPNIFKAQSLRQELVALNVRINQINSRLRWIDDQHQQRREHRKYHEERMQARLDLATHKSRVSITDTLSASNSNDLKTKIRDTHSNIDALLASLINQAKSRNYSCFLQQLELSLTSLKGSPHEIDALRGVLKLVKQHLEHIKTVTTIQDQLNTMVSRLNHDKNSLQYSQSRLKTLQDSNPDLIHHNEQLAAKNIELDDSQQKNNKLRNKFLTATGVIGSASLITSIPFILTLTGILAVTLTPVLAIIPALALLAGIGIGITALVYAIKGKNNGNEIDVNTRTIKNNTNQMAKNLQEITNLQNETIPGYIKTINNQEQVMAQVRSSFNQEQLLVQQTLEQAKAIEPVSYAQLYPTLPEHQSLAAVNSPSPGFFSLIQQQPLGYAQLLHGPKPSAPPMEEVLGQQPFAFH